MRLTRLALIISFMMLVSGGCALGADTNMLPNCSFEFGYGSVPQDWSGFGFAERALAGERRQGERSALLKAAGDDISWWHPSKWQAVDYNRLYQVSYWSRADLVHPGGSIFAGLSLAATRTTPTPYWQQTRFYFRSPDYLPERQFRLGECYVNGSVYFDDVSLRPALAAHRSRGLGRFVLGSGETIADRHYLAVHDLCGPGSCDARFLDSYTAAFDHDRWVLDRIDEIIYHHEISYFGVEDVRPNVGFSPQAARDLGVMLDDPRSLRCLLQDAAAVDITVSRCTGSLSLQFSTHGKRGRWKEAAVITRPGTFHVEVPRSMLPCRGLWVRLKSLRASRVEVTGYRYGAITGKGPAQTDSTEPVIGDTRYLTILNDHPHVTLQLTDVGELTPNGRSEVRAVIGNKGDRRKLRVSLLVRTGHELISHTEEEFPLARGSRTQVCLPYQVAAAGNQTLRIAITDADEGEILGALETYFDVAPIHETSGGETLFSDPALTVWWSRPERKVSRTRPAPTAQGSALRISAAANEYEAAQLVLTPTERLRACSLTPTDLVSATGARLPASQVSIRSVGYVTITLPSDDAAAVGDWPDPLLPHTQPTDLAGRLNHPFWITVYVPPGTPPGDYRGEIAITTRTPAAADNADKRLLTIPLELHVWAFALPKETHLRTACGLSTPFLLLYHRLDTKEELERVTGLYLADFAAHRLSPTGLDHDIWVDWRKSPSGEIASVIDYSDFDLDALRTMDQFGCNALLVKLPGLGGRTRAGWQQGNIAGYPQGSSQHEAAFTEVARAIHSHLLERGWLDCCYVTWFDQMRKGDFSVVRDGMALIKRAAPGLKRMLAAPLERELAGYVDAWLVPFHQFDPVQATERKAAGEEVWWYQDQRPAAPRLFAAIDHPAAEVRLWPWGAWKHRLDGLWLPQANYWHSSVAYPGELPQNPWADPMSWISTIEARPHEKEAWGNGYGRFLYPPNQVVGVGATKALTGPIPSLRWELLRDGLEDYEYLHLLRSHVERLRQANAEPSACQEAEQLLALPDDLWADPTHFTTDPEAIHTYRGRVATAVERLADL